MLVGRRYVSVSFLFTADDCALAGKECPAYGSTITRDLRGIALEPLGVVHARTLLTEEKKEEAMADADGENSDEGDEYAKGYDDDDVTKVASAADVAESGAAGHEEL